ncbi:MAG: hypothetical protein G01um101416_337 [Microgenomates group bacterium Gr01-1014_16]|nr:MAG: hypothetical protein G01um101416_337 [Microgenomates group bacterium Gr01-1014_16]
MPSEQQSLINAKASLRALINAPDDRLQELLWRMTIKPLSKQQRELALEVIEKYTTGEINSLSHAIICVAGQ